MASPFAFTLDTRKLTALRKLLEVCTLFNDLDGKYAAQQDGTGQPAPFYGRAYYAAWSLWLDMGLTEQEWDRFRGGDTDDNGLIAFLNEIPGLRAEQQADIIAAAILPPDGRYSIRTVCHGSLQRGAPTIAIELCREPDRDGDQRWPVVAHMWADNDNARFVEDVNRFLGTVA